MGDTNKKKTYRVGTFNWKRGHQDAHSLLDITEPGDTLLFPSRVYEIKKQLAVHTHLTLRGSNGSIILIPNRTVEQHGFNEQGLQIAGTAHVLIKNIIFECEPGTHIIETPASFSGKLTLEKVETRHKRRVLYKDVRQVQPSIKIRGRGHLHIMRSTLDMLDIDAPDMTVTIEKSAIGSFEHSSQIKAKSITVINSTINNTYIVADKGEFTELITNGGLALSGTHQLIRTHLIPLNPARPSLYPEAMTYIITMPKTILNLEGIKSNTPLKPPFYRHFDFRESKVWIKESRGLSEQLLRNVMTKSTVYAQGLTWLQDPTQEDQQLEQQRLTHAYKTMA